MKHDKSQIRNMVDETIDRLIDEMSSKYYGEEYTTEYEPLVDGYVDVTEDEIDYLDNVLQPSYYITFHKYETPDTYDYPGEVEYSTDGDDQVYADIEKIQDESLKERVKEDFQAWLSHNQESDKYDFSEPDYELDESRNFTDVSETMPEPMRLLVVCDKNGKCAGDTNPHTGTPIVWDGHRFTSDMGHRVMVDLNNIVSWMYADEYFSN